MTPDDILVPLTDEELAEIAAGHMRHSPTCMRLIADLRATRAALTEAIEEMEDMVAYVPDYFREKWEYDKTIARIKAVLDG